MIKYDKETKQRIRALTREKIPESNLLISKIMLVLAAVCFAAFGFFQLGILKTNFTLQVFSLIMVPIGFIIASIYCLNLHGRGRAFPLIFISLFMLFWMGLEMMSGFRCKLLVAALIVITLRYYNRKLTILSYILAVIALFLSVLTNAFLYDRIKLIDLNSVSIEGLKAFEATGFLFDEVIKAAPNKMTMFTNGLLLEFLPNLVFLSLIAFVSLRFMKYNLERILQAEMLAARESLERFELADLKTKAMLSQMKPHFVYNTLTSITSLCYINPDKAAKLTMDFADYVRNNIDLLGQNNETLCSFEEELDHIKTYLNVELVRFEDELSVQYDTKELSFAVPTLSIQPIVENAVKHGVSKKIGGGTVKLSTSKTEGGYLIVVSDDGVGFDVNEVKDDGRNHVGIENIKKRVALIGGIVAIESEKNVGTTVTVFIPEEGGQINDSLRS